MKKEIVKHTIPLVVLFVVTTLFWLFHHTPYYNYFHLFFGLFFGAFFIDIDHILYWFIINPNKEESRLAKIIIKKKDFSNLIKLLESTHKSHLSLLFHHSTTQIVLILISLFLFSSSNNIFAISFLLATNIHLSIDQIHILLKPHKIDLINLQKWLFARLPFQLPIKYLKHYVYLFLFINIVLSFFLIQIAI